MRLPKFCMEIFKECDIKLEVYDLTIYFHPEVYKPSDDTYMIIESLDIEEGEKMLDMGSGTGIIGIYAAKNGAFQVVSIDVNPKASLLTLCNAYVNNVIHEVDVISSSLFSALSKKVRFDLIVFNPPYLPVTNRGVLEKSWSGGKTGREIIDTFLREFHRFLKPNGRLIMVQSSLSRPGKTIKELEKLGFKVRRAKSKKFFYEELVVLKAYKKRTDRNG